MSFFFEPHPRINYDLLKNKKPINIQNPLVRFKLAEALKDAVVIFHEFEVEDGQGPQEIADKYYEDVSLDWVLFLVNDIIDPQFDWPLDYEPLTNFIADKYGSVNAAMTGTHHFEWIQQAEQTLSDGTVVDEKVIIVDATTFATLPTTDRRAVTNFDYEVNTNDAKRKIKILDSDFIDSFLLEVERIFT